MNPADIHRDGPTEDIEEHCMPMPDEFKIEEWECRACGDSAPCRISITYQETGFDYIDQQDRFVRRGCVCGEPRPAEWKRIMASTTPQPSAPAQTPTATEAPSPTGAAE